eukprot:COSAG02_NODE_2532_length_8593_cov_2.538969_10_plen_139_part_00
MYRYSNMTYEGPPVSALTDLILPCTRQWNFELTSVPYMFNLLPVPGSRLDTLEITSRVQPLAVELAKDRSHNWSHATSAPDYYYINDDCKVRPGGRVQLPPARPSHVLRERFVAVVAYASATTATNRRHRPPFGATGA